MWQNTWKNQLNREKLILGHSLEATVPYGGEGMAAEVAVAPAAGAGIKAGSYLGRSESRVWVKSRALRDLWDLWHLCFSLKSFYNLSTALPSGDCVFKCPRVQWEFRSLSFHKKILTSKALVILLYPLRKSAAFFPYTVVVENHDPLPGITNKVLLKLSCTHPCMYCLWLFSQCSVAVI